MTVKTYSSQQSPPIELPHILLNWLEDDWTQFLWSGESYSFPAEVQEIAENVFLWMIEEGTIVCYFDNEVMVGYCESLYDAETDTTMLSKFLINPLFKRQGHATKMLTQVLHLAEATHPNSKVEILVNSGNTAGMGFFEKNGFELILIGKGLRYFEQEDKFFDLNILQLKK